ncbi:MAG TPA: AI-2E family transporter [Albitalea sp.]|nr:AI-2E family transporter [Albitalea sp.]
MTMKLPLSGPKEPAEPPIVPPDRAGKVALAMMAAALLLVLLLRLFLVLVIGLATYALHRGLTRVLARWVSVKAARRVALGILLLLFAAAGVAIASATSHVTSSSTDDGLPRFMHFMADSLERLRSTLPPWITEHLPETPADLQAAGAGWLREHASAVQVMGYHTLRALAYVLAGIVIGLLASVQAPGWPRGDRPFAAAWRDRLAQLEEAFVRVAAAQLRIALLNTVFTAIYLLAVLPALGHPLPFRGTLVALTFVAGLLPIVGNLVSNTAIVLTSLSVAPWLALLSLGYLIAIHKLEYFLNAHIVGERISVPSYELLAAMLVFEAAFGLPGLVAAPIYYAWATRELRRCGAI